jgi:Domain of unknown function (DUF4184)
MAFPLAHPAAVLPLRRFCPRWLSLPALMIGSVTPDLGYILQAQHVDEFSHRFLGSFGFCLPVGIIAMVLFYALRAPAVKLLPERYQRALLPLCGLPRRPALVVLASLLIGSWTHLFWDSCTHNDGWLAQQFPVLQTAVFTVGYRTARVSLLLWYASSFAGLIWLVLAFEKWKQSAVKGSASVPGKAVVRDAVLVAFLLLPIAVVHHLLQRAEVALYLAAALCALLALLIILKLSSNRADTAERQDSA